MQESVNIVNKYSWLRLENVWWEKCPSQMGIRWSVFKLAWKVFVTLQFMHNNEKKFRITERLFLLLFLADHCRTSFSNKFPRVVTHQEDTQMTICDNQSYKDDPTRTLYGYNSLFRMPVFSPPPFPEKTT